ncbi:MAG TPA: hypothetical protein VIK26_10980, partial [Clostridium sp.]
VHMDGYPKCLGAQLKIVYKAGMQIEAISNQLTQIRKKKCVDFLIKWDHVDIDTANKCVVKGVSFLSPEQVSIAKSGGLKAARKVIEINLEYMYIIKDDGIYVKGVTVPMLRKVNLNEVYAYHEML